MQKDRFYAILSLSSILRIKNAISNDFIVITHGLGH